MHLVFIKQTAKTISAKAKIGFNENRERGTEAYFCRSKQKIHLRRELPLFSLLRALWKHIYGDNEAMANSFVSLNVDSEDAAMILIIFFFLSPICSCGRRKASAVNLSASNRCLSPILSKHIRARISAYKVQRCSRKMGHEHIPLNVDKRFLCTARLFSASVGKWYKCRGKSHANASAGRHQLWIDFIKKQ